MMKLPTIIIQSRADSSGSYPEAKWVASQLPGSEFITVEESGHFVWLGPNTHKWEKKLKKFLDHHQPSDLISASRGCGCCGDWL